MVAKADKTTAFLRAARSGHLTIVKVTIKKNARIDKQNTIMFTDLMAASVNGHADVVRLLLANGANPDLKNNEGKTAIDYAENSSVKRLLERAGVPGQE